MLPDIFYGRIVAPAVQWMDASPGVGIRASNEARVLLMAIAGQESNWQYRRQNGGPARSFWQFEKGGGVAGLFAHPATKDRLAAVCGACDVPYDLATVFEAMAWHDMLACAMARLLLWSDPAPLPAIGDRETAWAYYLRNWQPGVPRPDHWAGVYGQAVAAVGAKPVPPPARDD